MQKIIVFNFLYFSIHRYSATQKGSKYIFFKLISFENEIITFKTHLSKDTYIRNLIENICNNLVCTKQSIFS